MKKYQNEPQAKKAYSSCCQLYLPPNTANMHPEKSIFQNNFSPQTNALTIFSSSIPIESESEAQQTFLQLLGFCFLVPTLPPYSAASAYPPRPRGVGRRLVALIGLLHGIDALVSMVTPFVGVTLALAHMISNPTAEGLPAQLLAHKAWAM